ncbi:MAG: bifunctional UDP-3-O-[3-hydroxymyristoyl] N-acetylglucosamine deacetylase/3-hydroxyacyl-ACP dehydratase [Gemmatimonadaceae bacterium]|nr:bifunctional UDP-3-O-[3-hydroxymyristoyl] N-acetylglucosamine deacetylase/3-hydroxyacyl-ACP dehydratase [Gemmatimonadaceae bacterium]
MARRTVGGRVEMAGVGLHYGRACRRAFAPSDAGAGIRFRRTDLPGAPETPAHVSRAVATERRTQLGAGEGSLHTVEHVLAAVAGCGLDDILIEMDAPEPPIMDGSARPFLDALAAAGIVEHPGAPAQLRLAGSVRVVDGESVYVAHPADSLDIEVTVDFPHPLIGAQSGRWQVTESTFRSELAAARTFGFLREVEALRAKGLIQGASTSNAIVLDDDGVVDNTLRWPDEFLRHKALDVVGDLALAGARVCARISAHKPSHRGTVTLVRELLANAQKEERVIEIDEIMKVLPHRYPFLLVDRILELEPNTRVVGIKNVTVNEPFFQGHFPGHPVMPGVLIVEAMAQVGGMLLLGMVDDPGSKVVYFMSLDNVKFRKPVKPGDQVRFELEMKQVRGKVCRMAGIAKVDGAVVCEAEMAAMVRER